MEETIEMLVGLSGMPFSAVVIGVGDGDFEKMEVLDADGEALRDKNEKEAIRDIVQLVQYGEFKDLGERELAQEVLGELPDQFVDYMVMKDNERHKIYTPPGEPSAAEINAANSNEDIFAGEQSIKIPILQTDEEEKDIEEDHL